MHALTARLPLAPPSLDALDRIVKNLVSNALKYSPPGTRVRVRACATAAAARGAGLGLAVVKSLVEAHGGRIRAHSEPAQGTRMAVVLPALP